jgi:hypothetical protein
LYGIPAAASLSITSPVFTSEGARSQNAAKSEKRSGRNKTSKSKLNVSPDEVLSKFLCGDIPQIVRGDDAVIAFLPQARGAWQPAALGQELQD